MTRKFYGDKDWEKENDLESLKSALKEFVNDDYDQKKQISKEELNNNGWIKIESEDDLPKENIDCFCILESGKILITNSRKEYFWCSDNKWLYNYYEFTHYQPIEKPKPPIY